MSRRLSAHNVFSLFFGLLWLGALHVENPFNECFYHLRSLFQSGYKILCVLFQFFELLFPDPCFMLGGLQLIFQGMDLRSCRDAVLCHLLKLTGFLLSELNITSHCLLAHRIDLIVCQADVFLDFGFLFDLLKLVFLFIHLGLQRFQTSGFLLDFELGNS